MGDERSETASTAGDAPPLAPGSQPGASAASLPLAGAAQPPQPRPLTASDIAQGRGPKEDGALLDVVHRLKLRCPRCRYDLSDAVSTTCPECGVRFRAADFRVGLEALPASPRLVCTLVGLCAWIAGGGLLLGLTLLPGLAGLVAGVLATLLTLWLLVRIARRPVTYLTKGEHIRLSVDLLLALPGVLAILTLLAGGAWYLAAWLRLMV